MNFIRTARRNVSKALIAATAATVLLPVAWTTPSANAAVGTASYEVKFSLKPEVVLDSSHNLVSAVRSEFGTGSSYKSYRTQFMDTAGLTMDAQGWSERIRKRSDQSTHEIQFKKRYPIVGGDLNAALTQAANDGLDSGSGFDFEVDWGYTKQTLSVSKEADVTVSGSSGSGLNMPNEATSRTVSVSNAPTKFKNWTSTGWGTTQLNNAVVFGPVDFKRYTGEIGDLDLDIEIWAVRNATNTGTEYLVEASFKTDSTSEATSTRAELQEALEDNGWLLPQDVLRTDLIMERYAPVAPTPDTTAPSAPTGLAATAASSSQINLSWTAATDNVAVTGYDVYRGSTLVGSTSATAYSDTGLTASTAYSYTVKAKDAAGNISAASNSATSTTQASGGTGGGGTLYYTINGSTGSYIEAEQYTAKNGTFVSATCSACSGGQDMETPNGSGNAATNYVKYELDVTNGGSFNVYLLSTGPDGSSDSFNVAVDSGSDAQVTTGSSGTWAWKKVGSSLSLPTGTHTLYIKVREDGAKVDKIYLSKTSGTPSGQGGTALTPSTR